MLEPAHISTASSGASAAGSGSAPDIVDPEPFSLLGAKTESERVSLKQFIASQLRATSSADSNTRYSNIKPEYIEEAMPFVSGQEQMRWKVQSCDTLPLWWLSDSYRLNPGVDVQRFKEAWNKTFDAEPVS